MISMLRDRTAKDLLLLTLVKIGVIVGIYHFCFAAFDGRPVDAASHLLGSSVEPPRPGAYPTK